METFSLGELSVAVVTIAGAIAVLLKASQHSRCTKINLCYFVSCERDVTEEEVENIEVVTQAGENKEIK